MLPEVLHAFRDELEKIGVTRSVKEWRASSAAGDTAGAGQIAGASHQLGLKPRYLKDISTGGEEAGVDLMMGHKAGPTGESNQGGLLARKLYKPDSTVSQAEFTPQLLEQKQRATDTARSLSPATKNMVPAMYGHETQGAGTPLQRTQSFHQYVPGITNLQEGPRGQAAASAKAVQEHVLNPMEAKGMTMSDTVRNLTGGGKGINPGNVVGSPTGAKVLDFLPQMAGESNPAVESMKKYAPIHGPSKFTEAGGGAGLAALRKENFKPTMQSVKAPYMDRVMSHAAMSQPAPAMTGAVHVPTPAPAINALGVHSDPFKSTGSRLMQGVGQAAKNFFRSGDFL